MLKKRKNRRKRKAILMVFILLLLIIIIAIVIGLITRKKKNEKLNEIVSAPEVEYVDIEQVEAPYEHWLAAAVVTSISMDYPDFELQKIYLSGETALEQYMESEGVCVSFITSGEEKYIHSKPIEKLRDEEGTFDIFAEYIGYATYDEMENVDFEQYQESNIDNMGVLIEQLVRVTKFMN